MKAVEDECRDLRDENAQLKNVKATLELRVAELDQELDQAMSESFGIQHEFMSMNESINQLLKEISDLEEKLRISQSELKTTQNQF